MTETVELYQDCKSELINAVLFSLKNFDAEQINQVKTALDIAFYKYEIKKKGAALVVYDEGVNEMLVRRFLVSKQVQGCTKKTLQYYKGILKIVLWKINKPCTEITTDDIRYYLALRETQDHVSKVSLDNELRVLKSFYGFLLNEEIVTKNPAMKISKIRGRKQVKKAFSDIEIELLRDACTDPRETFLIEFFLSTGCRVGEVAQILLEDIQDDKIIVHGKGQKDRAVYLNAKAQVSLKTYLASRGETKSKYLFNSDYLLKYPKDKGLDIGTLRTIVKKVGERAGVDNCHPHRFRRTCATLALRRGMPIEQVSQMLGHESIDTTQIYLDLREEDLAAAHKKYVV